MTGADSGVVTVASRAPPPRTGPYKYDINLFSKCFIEFALTHWFPALLIRFRYPAMDSRISATIFIQINGIMTRGNGGVRKLGGKKNSPVINYGGIPVQG